MVINLCLQQQMVTANCSSDICHKPVLFFFSNGTGTSDKPVESSFSTADNLYNLALVGPHLHYLASETSLGDQGYPLLFTGLLVNATPAPIYQSRKRNSGPAGSHPMKITNSTLSPSRGN